MDAIIKGSALKVNASVMPNILEIYVKLKDVQKIVISKVTVLMVFVNASLDIMENYVRMFNVKKIV